MFMKNKAALVFRLPILGPTLATVLNINSQKLLFCLDLITGFVIPLRLFQTLAKVKGNIFSPLSNLTKRESSQWKKLMETMKINIPSLSLWFQSSKQT